MKSQYVLPITIVVAGALVAGAVFLVGTSSGPRAPSGENSAVRPVDPRSDWILGNPQAPVMVIEYSDLECQFCKEFHSTMHRVMNFYGDTGNVAWVYRHFPLIQLHPKAAQEAEAAQCAGELGGNTGFWTYIDRIFEITPSGNNLDLALLPVVAKETGLDVAAFNECLASGRHRATVTASAQEALAAGARGTPFTLVLVNGSLVEGGALGGAQPYDSMRAIIDVALANLQIAPVLQTP